MVNDHVVTNKFDRMQKKSLWPKLSWNLPDKSRTWRNLRIITVSADILAMDLQNMSETLSPKPTSSSTTQRQQLELHMSLTQEILDYHELNVYFMAFSTTFCVTFHGRSPDHSSQLSSFLMVLSG